MDLNVLRWVKRANKCIFSVVPLFLTLPSFFSFQVVAKEEKGRDEFCIQVYKVEVCVWKLVLVNQPFKHVFPFASLEIVQNCITQKTNFFIKHEDSGVCKEWPSLQSQHVALWISSKTSPLYCSHLIHIYLDPGNVPG